MQGRGCTCPFGFAALNRAQATPAACLLDKPLQVYARNRWDEGGHAVEEACGRRGGVGGEKHEVAWWAARRRHQLARGCSCRRPCGAWLPLVAHCVHGMHSVSAPAGKRVSSVVVRLAVSVTCRGSNPNRASGQAGWHG